MDKLRELICCKCGIRKEIKPKLETVDDEKTNEKYPEMEIKNSGYWRIVGSKAYCPECVNTMNTHPVEDELEKTIEVQNNIIKEMKEKYIHYTHMSFDELKLLSDNLIKLEADKKNLEKQVERQTENYLNDVGKLKKEIERLNQEISQINSDHMNAENNLEHMTDLHEDLEKQNAELEADKKNLEKGIERLRGEQLEGYKLGMSDMENTCKNEINDLKKENAELKKEIEILKLDW